MVLAAKQISNVWVGERREVLTEVDRDISRMGDVLLESAFR